MNISHLILGKDMMIIDTYYAIVKYAMHLCSPLSNDVQLDVQSYQR